MRGLRFERMLASTAMVLVLVTAAGAAKAGPDTEQAIEAAVPMPEPANVPPPSAADIGGAPAKAVPDTQTSATKDDVTSTTTPPATNAPAAAPVTANAPAAAPAPAAPVQAAAPSSPAATEPPAAAREEPKDQPKAQTAEQPKDQPKSEIAANLAPEDRAVAERLHDILSGRIERLFPRKNERAAVETFYRERGYAPLWVEKGAQSPRATAAIAYLKGVDAVGLDPADYPTPDFKSATSPDVLADAELKLTGSVLTYARHAQIGQVHYSRISADISYDLQAPDPAGILANMASATNIAEALDGYNPPQPGFKALKAKLAEIRAHDGDSGAVRIGHGPLLKVGMHDERVPLLRERLGLAGDSSNTTYDKVLAAAIKKFQREHDLTPTGNLNSSTIAALNGPRRDHVADIIVANMERWRWMPRDLGKAYVMVNLPDYTLRVVDNGKTVWTTKIVIGKPTKPTPLLSETMKYITVNPTWNVPPSIVQNEYLPALQQDPDALDRIGLKVVQNRDGTIHIYQPPGDRNALGRIRFNFPNKFLVYQHDTPDKYLFAKEKRAYSHGCMRVQDPLKYGEVLLSIANPKDGYTAERLHRMYGSEEQNINLRTPIPVHLTYQTAFVDDAGKLQIREDIYGRDARVIAALRNEDHRVADIPVERREASNRPVVMRTPLPMVSRRVNSAGDFFFGLFR